MQHVLDMKNPLQMFIIITSGKYLGLVSVSTQICLVHFLCSYVTTLLKIVPGQPACLDQTLFPIQSYNSWVLSLVGLGPFPLAQVGLHLVMSMKVTPLKVMLKNYFSFYLSQQYFTSTASFLYFQCCLFISSKIDKTHFSSSSTWKRKRQSMA